MKRLKTEVWQLVVVVEKVIMKLLLLVIVVEETVEADVVGDGDVEVDRDGGDVARTTGDVESDVDETCI